MDEPTTRREPGIHRHRAIDLAFTGRVLGDVGHMVTTGAGELVLDQVGGGRLGSRPAAVLGAAGDALQAGAAQPAAPRRGSRP